MESAISLGTFSVALIVALITGQQAWTNRLRLRHELFERRFEVFKAAQVYISKIMEEGGLNDEMLGTLYPEFVDAWQQSRFLFGKDIVDYLDRIRAQSIQLHSLRDRGKHTEANGNLAWLCAQAPELFKRFGPYMKFAVK